VVSIGRSYILLYNSAEFFNFSKNPGLLTLKAFLSSETNLHGI
jgi:hypothetical protein